MDQPEQPTQPDPAAEQLLAVMDVEAIMRPRAKIRVTQEMRQRAARLPNLIAAEVRRFLTSSEQEKERPLPPFKFKEALELLTEFDPEQRIAALAEKFTADDDASGVIVAAGRAIKYLKTILPVRSRLTMTGPETQEPNDLIKYRFRRAYTVIEDPMQVFGDLREGALGRDQVRTLKAIYPSLYDVAEKAVVMGLAELKGDRPTLQLASWKTRQLENLLLTRTWTPELARVMQEAFKKGQQPAKNQPSPTGLTDKTSDASETPIQRIANK